MKNYNKIKTYFPIFVWPALVFAFHQICMETRIYDRLKWLDTPMHFLGGISIAVSTFFLFNHLEKNKQLQADIKVKRFLVLSITALAAVLWEQAEFGSDTILHTIMQPTVWDTMKDLTMGLLGATVVAFLWKDKK